MSISPFIFLIVYAVGALIFVVLASMNFYHVIRFGHLRAPSIIVSLIFLVLTVTIVLTTFGQLRSVIWDENIPLNIIINLPSSTDVDDGF